MIKTTKIKTETLRVALPGEEETLKALWKLCFGDTDRYLNWFFARGYTPGQGLVLEAEGELVSMLLLFPQEILSPEGDAVPVWYIYAFCTHPDYQGRGYGRRLLAYTEGKAAQMGKHGVVMVPGERSLFDFYEGLGYETGFSTWEQTIPRENSAEQLPSVVPCSLEDYQRLRADRLRGGRWIRYPDKTAAWQESLCRGSGGGLYRVGGGIAAVECWGGAVAVKELLSDCPEQSAQALLLALGAERALVRTPVPLGKGPGKPFGVVKWLDPEAEEIWSGHRDGYLAFAFD